MFLITQAKCYTIILNPRFVRLYIYTHSREYRFEKKTTLLLTSIKRFLSLH